MLTAEMRKANHNWWMAVAESIEIICSDYTYNIEEDRRLFTSMEKQSFFYFLDGIKYLLLEKYETASRLLSLSAEAAETAIEKSDFDQPKGINGANSISEKKLRQEYYLVGLVGSWTMKLYSQWLLTGYFDRAYLERTMCYRTELQTHCSTSKDKYLIAEDMMLYMISERYEDAIERYKMRYQPANSIEKSSKSSPVHVLHCICKHIIGDVRYTKCALSGLEHWCKVSLDWAGIYTSISLLETERINWLYLYYRLIHGNQDIREMIINLRGW